MLYLFPLGTRLISEEAIVLPPRGVSPLHKPKDTVRVHLLENGRP